MAATRRNVKDDPQDGLFDEVIENDVLERALERRQAKKERQSSAAEEFRKADEAARGLLPELDPDTVARCGRFRISVKRRKGRSVSFETEEKTQTTISALE